MFDVKALLKDAFDKGPGTFTHKNELYKCFDEIKVFVRKKTVTTGVGPWKTETEVHDATIVQLLFQGEVMVEKRLPLFDTMAGDMLNLEDVSGATKMVCTSY
jgi:hypothetical protein